MAEFVNKANQPGNAVGLGGDPSSDSVLVALAKAQSLFRLAGKSGASNLAAMGLDVYLTNSALTKRTTYKSIDTPIVFELFPEALRDSLMTAFTWADRGLAIGLLREEELESALENPQILEDLVARFTSGQNRKPSIVDTVVTTES
jgi:hypothetical protein